MFKLHKEFNMLWDTSCDNKECYKNAIWSCNLIFFRLSVNKTIQWREGVETTVLYEVRVDHWTASSLLFFCNRICARQLYEFSELYDGRIVGVIQPMNIIFKRPFIENLRVCNFQNVLPFSITWGRGTEQKVFFL